jgi:hypothetical protein
MDPGSDARIPQFGHFDKAELSWTRRFSKVWDHAANRCKALFLSSWNCSIARVGEGETDFNILSAKPISEKMFRGASSLRFAAHAPGWFGRVEQRLLAATSGR